MYHVGSTNTDVNIKGGRGTDQAGITVTINDKVAPLSVPALPPMPSQLTPPPPPVQDTVAPDSIPQVDSFFLHELKDDGGNTYAQVLREEDEAETTTVVTENEDTTTVLLDKQHWDHIHSGEEGIPDLILLSKNVSSSKNQENSWNDVIF